MLQNYVVSLSQEERTFLQKFLQQMQYPPYLRRQAQILLYSDTGRYGQGFKDHRIAACLGVCKETVLNTRKRFVAQGLDFLLKHHS